MWRRDIMSPARFLTDAPALIPVQTREKIDSSRCCFSVEPVQSGLFFKLVRALAFTMANNEVLDNVFHRSTNAC